MFRAIMKSSPFLSGIKSGLSRCVAFLTQSLLLVATIPAFAVVGEVDSVEFEASEGYLAGLALIGQGGWTGEAPISPLGSGVTTDLGGPGQGQYAYIGGYTVPIIGANNFLPVELKQAVRRDLKFVPDGDEVLTVSLDLIPHLEGVGPFPDQFRIALRNSDGSALCSVILAGGSILVADQNLQPESSGASFSSGFGQSLSFELSFSKGTWSAFYGTIPIATDRSLLGQGLAANLEEIELRWERLTLFPETSMQNYLLFDNLAVSSAQVVLPPTLLTLVPDRESDDVRIEVETGPNAEVTLQYTPDLVADWTDLAELTADDSGLVTYLHEDVLHLGRGFYRIQLP